MSHPKAHTRLSLFLSKGLRARNSSSRGSALLYVIASIVLLGTIGGGVAYFSSSSSTSQLTQTRAEQAYYAAMAGKNYAEAISEGLTSTELDALVAAGASTYYVSDASRFTVGFQAPTGGLTNYSYTSVGMSDTSSLQGTYQIDGLNSITPGTETPEPEEPPNLITYNFIASKEGFAEKSGDQTREYSSEKDNADIKPENLTIGASMKYGFGNIWFSGRVSGLAQDGVMSFGNGFSAFLTFKFTTAPGDGFTFSVINGTRNNYASCGGDSAMGELLGYAGDSRVYKDGSFGDGTIIKYMDSSGMATPGLHPPKFSVEIDNYVNNGNKFDRTVQCTGLLDNTRQDYSKSHIAIMLWGDDSEGYPAKICPKGTTNFKGNEYTYDDNVHGIGENAGAVEGGQLKQFDFDKDKTYYLRVDAIRSTNANETGTYNITAWVYSCSKKNCINTIFGGYSSLSDTQHYWTEKSIDNSSNAKVTKTFTLTNKQHQDFSKFLFGITSASGDSTQTIVFRNISISLH